MRETFDGSYSGSTGGGGWGDSLGSLATGEEAYSTSFSPNATGGPTASISTELKNMLESSKDGLKLEAMKRLVAVIAKRTKRVEGVKRVSDLL